LGISPITILYLQIRCPRSTHLIHTRHLTKFILNHLKKASKI
jgi:hypothetical protein